MTTTCRSCDAEVVFVPSAKTGKPMILNAKPTKGIVLVDATHEHRGKPSPDNAAVLITVDHYEAAQVVDVYTDHHSTCPDAARYRRTR